MNTLLLIDPQNDFIDHATAALPVAGAKEDLERVIKKMDNFNFDQIVVTLDQHFSYDIAHGSFWKNEQQQHPKPFTKITYKDLLDGKWLPVDATKLAHCMEYVYALSLTQKYDLIIWPEHCLINSWGAKIYNPLLEKLKVWENDNNKKVKKITKGENPLTEHYSALKAEFVLKSDTKTDVNMELINQLKDSKFVYVAGEAFTHCVYSTIRDLMEYFNKCEISPTFIIYENGTSPVLGFEDQVGRIKAELSDLGVQFKKI